MKALSLIQPWATLVAIGAKEYETRGWSTPYRGPIAIHASRWRARNGVGIISAQVQEYLALCRDEPFRSVLTRAGVERIGDLPSGAIVATARLVSVVRTEACVVDDLEREFGNFGPGRFAWRLAGVRPLAKPVEIRGAQGLWDVPADILSTVANGGNANG